MLVEILRPPPPPPPLTPCCQPSRNYKQPYFQAEIDIDKKQHNNNRSMMDALLF